jgi:outer membrane phospholipase A
VRTQWIVWGGLVFLVTATRPCKGQDTEPEVGTGSEGTSLFLNSFGFHEPLYFAVGDEPRLNAKFQLSVRYRFVHADRADALPSARPERGLYFAYTQLSFIDLEAPSVPFFDTSYKPSAFFLYQAVGGQNHWWGYQFDIEAGYEHESNGKGGDNSRAINILYAKPAIVWRVFTRSHLTVAPKVWVYIEKGVNTTDIEEYRGYFDVELTWRWEGSLQISTLTHVGSEWDRGSFQMDVTFPMNRLWEPLNFYLLGQFFTGYAETMLRYDQRTAGTWRLGMALSR